MTVPGAIMDALNDDFAEFKSRLVNTFRTECGLFDDRLGEERELLRRYMERTEELERENQTLRSRLECSAKHKSAHSLQTSTPTTSRSRSAGSEDTKVAQGRHDEVLDDDGGLKLLVSDLQKSLQQKDLEIARYDHALDQMTAKAREFKNALIVEREKRKQERTTQKATSRSPQYGPIEKTSQYEASPHVSTPIGLSPRRHGAVQDRDAMEAIDSAAGRKTPQLQPSGHIPDQTKVLPHDQSLKIPSRSGDDVEASHSALKSTPSLAKEPQNEQDIALYISSSDSPQIVSERRLKRKRTSEPRGDTATTHVKIEHDALQADELSNIKEEPLTVNRHPNGTNHTQFPNDSMDLDDMNLPLLATPRKTRKAHEQSPKQQSRVVGASVWKPAGSRRIDKERGDHFEQSGADGHHRDAAQHITNDATKQSPSKSTYMPPDTHASIKARNVIESTEQVESATEDQKPRGEDVLKPKTSNLRVTQNRLAEDMIAHKSRRNDNAVRIAMLTEDGDEYAMPTQTRRGKSDIGSLLNGPTDQTERPHLPDIHRSRVRHAQAQSRPSPISAIDKEDKEPRHISGKDVSGPQKQARDSNRRTSPAQASTRLREYNVGHLRPTDFILNPARNEGLDYAFSDVVRKRDERRCLPNCTKPECCGNKFDKVIRLGGYVAPQRTSLGNELHGIHLSENDSLIIEYLGCGLNRLLTMPEVEKDDVLRQAMAWKLGQSHGRHRAAHERKASPPGFWRTDMPTTQEERDDRAKAEEQERQQVEIRYKEAMRPGGRWKFRDEAGRA